MSDWKNDTELFELMKSELYTPVVGDILDGLGCYHQFLPQPIRPLTPGMKIAGRAMPVLMMDVYGAQQKPFGLMTEALDDLRENEIYIAAGALNRSANWGEIMTAAAKARGAAGAVVDGFHRDTPQVLSQDFPVFSCGPWAQDSGPRMKIAGFRVPIEIGGIPVAPGDLVFGDVDGVLIIPQSLETETIRRALEKARGEKLVRRAIEAGRTVTEVFAEFGIL